MIRPTYSRRVKFRWIPAIVLIAILIAVILPFFFNKHFTSLGRFSDSVSLGAPESRVASQMEEFQKKHESNTTYSERTASFDLYGEAIDSSRIISLRQESIFDDVEFQVLFSNGVVAQTLYIGD